MSLDVKIDFDPKEDALPWSLIGKILTLVTGVVLLSSAIGSAADEGERSTSTRAVAAAHTKVRGRIDDAVGVRRLFAPCPLAP